MLETLRLIVNIVILCTGVHALWPAQIVSEFFIYRNIHAVDAVLCNEKDRVHLLKHFSRPTGSGHLIESRTQNTFDLQRIDPENRLGIFLDLSCSKNHELLSSISEDWFTIAFTWLIWDERGLLETSNVKLPISTFSEVYSITKTSHILRIRKDRRELAEIIDTVGFWDRKMKRLVFSSTDVRINFQKTSVMATIMFIQNVYNKDKLSEQLLNETYEPGKDVCNRFMYGNAFHLAYLYNYTLKLTIAETWGDRNPNGSWTGMLGLLQRKEADIALGGLLPLARRMDISYPAIPDLPFWMAICFKQPRALGTYRAMILELSPSTWIGVTLLLLAGAIVFTITQKYEPDNQPTADDSSFEIGFLQSIGILASQGLPLVPQGTSARIVCLSLLLVSLLVTNYYNAATMTALLSKSPPVIKNLEELLKQDLPLASLDAPYLKPKPRLKVFHRVLVDKMDKLSICKIENCVRAVMNGSAFFTQYFLLFQAINDHVKSDAICDISVFPAGPISRIQGFMKKCPHFREMTLRGQLRAMEHGLTQKERRKWILEKLTCSRVTSFIYIRLEAVTVALAIFVIGVIMSVAILVCEIVVWRRFQESHGRRIKGDMY